MGDEYCKFEEGNIVSVHTLFEYLAQSPYSQGRSKQELEDKCKEDIENLIVDTIKSVKGKIQFQKHTFELLGYDFILDEDLNTVLIEVNTNPCMEESNALLRRLLPRMLDDMLNVVMDPLFHPEGHVPPYRSKFKLPPEIFSVDSNCAGNIDFKESS